MFVEWTDRPFYYPCSHERDERMDNYQNLIESSFRWLHVVAGITWIGLLYFFNWINGPFMATLDADTKKKVVPELLPRTLFWFRWGAAYTWVSGLILLMFVYYHGDKGQIGAADGYTVWTWVCILATFFSVHVYDILVKKVLKDPKAAFFGGWVLATAMVYLFADLGGFRFRGYAIHLGAMFGTYMAFNVWFRIWPAQKKIITAIKNGEKPDPALVALAGQRSKHNTYMSFPLIFVMMSQHATWFAVKPYYLSIVIIVTWSLCYLCYAKAKTVKGF